MTISLLLLGWDLNSGLHTCKVDTLPLGPQSFCPFRSGYFGDGGLKLFPQFGIEPPSSQVIGMRHWHPSTNFFNSPFDSEPTQIGLPIFRLSVQLLLGRLQGPHKTPISRVGEKEALSFML
jgi:hypothetical protein